MLSRFTIIDAPGQEFSTFANGKKVTIRLRYSETTERFSLSLFIDETPVLSGRKLVANIDLLEPFDFGIGAIFAAGINDRTLQPTLENLVSGDVGLFHYVEAA